MCPPCLPLQTRGARIRLRPLPSGLLKKVDGVGSAQCAAKPRRVLVCCRNTKAAPGQSITRQRGAASISRVHDLQDAVTQLLAEDELCVLRHTHEHFVEFEPTTRASADHLARAQQRDEV